MPENFPSNGQVFTNALAINDQYPKVQFAGTEPNAGYFEIVECAGTIYNVQNASWNVFAGVWVQVNSALPSYAWTFTSGVLSFLTVPAGTATFTAWTTVSVSAANGQTGTKAQCTADGTASSAITFSSPFANACTAVQLTIGPNYTGTDNPAITARMYAVPTKTGCTIMVTGGQASSKVDVYYTAFGS